MRMRRYRSQRGVRIGLDCSAEGTKSSDELLRTPWATFIELCSLRVLIVSSSLLGLYILLDLTYLLPFYTLPLWLILTTFSY